MLKARTNDKSHALNSLMALNRSHEEDMQECEPEPEPEQVSASAFFSDRLFLLNLSSEYFFNIFYV